ncbi:hypothetical protein [Actinoplanes flavus]|uniref:Uncharacterized protein n=1 Tax=Actinoplanes flavus TaxID=2820290 RepID=A0ABS3UZI5_9ACTN|nr:hypothetical protein [Actinoplanes flavus]MBO3743994.1 hypothetical protein [Actinoplanes flavus]
MAFGRDEHLDPTLVHLDRAICMINNGDITQGVHHASTVLLDLPTDFRPAIVIRRANAVAAAVPGTCRRERRGDPSTDGLRR